MDFIALQTALAGQYFLERELGRGGMGVVYLARELRLDRPVAIKVLPPALATRAELRDRFLREARTAAKLSHPHIVPIHRVDEAGPFVYIAMAYVDGGTLGDRLRDGGTLPPAHVTRLVREVGWALAYAHARGIVHRDVKPDNILIDRETGRALVTDFGIAQLAAGDGAPITGEGMVMGTAHYMSPEQAAGEPLDGRSDLYALGVIAYQSLSGRLPFDAPTVPALLAKHLTQTAAPLDGVPPRLARVVHRCLAKTRDERPATGEALAELLDEAALAERALPAPLRVWAESPDPFAPAYALWSGVLTMIVLYNAGLMAFRPAQAARQHARLLEPALLALLPLVPIVVRMVTRTYAAVRAGFGVADMRVAMRRLVERKRADAATDVSPLPAWIARAMRAATYGGTALWLAVLLTFDVFFPMPRPRAPDFQRWMLYKQIVLGYGFMAVVGINALGSALGVTWPGRGGRGVVDGLRRRFWDSPAGAFLVERLTRHARRRGGAPVQVVDRPTEHVIGLAAADLYAALPDPTRRALGDLPDTLVALEREAEAMRVRAESLAAQVASVDLGSVRGMDQRREAVRADLDRARADAARRRDAAVTALETLRLDLLRLQADVAAPSDLTAIVERAQRLGSDVDARLAALDVARDARHGVAGVAAPRLPSPPSGERVGA